MLQKFYNQMLSVTYLTWNVTYAKRSKINEISLNINYISHDCMEEVTTYASFT